jgi:vacuolar iron transporter family protein
MIVIMKHSLKVGFSFGITSAIITTLGLIVGLNSSTHSKMVVIGGILMIAIADSFSDALGIHISEESEGKHSHKEIWESTISTFIYKFIFTLSFVVPFLIFNLATGVVISILWGLILLNTFSYLLAKKQRKKHVWKVVAEHFFIAIIVIVFTKILGEFVARFFV